MVGLVPNVEARTTLGAVRFLDFQQPLYSQLIYLQWNACKAIAARGVHRLVVQSRGRPWLELNVPSVPGRPILL